jgi:hypothetical protein
MQKRRSMDVGVISHNPTTTRHVSMLSQNSNRMHNNCFIAVCQKHYQLLFVGESSAIRFLSLQICSQLLGFPLLSLQCSWPSFCTLLLFCGVGARCDSPLLSLHHLLVPTNYSQPTTPKAAIEVLNAKAAIEVLNNKKYDGRNLE